MKSKTKSFGIRKIAFCALFTALIAVGAFIKIPIPLMPITLQTMFVCLAGLLLGARLGMMSAIIYMVLGLVGIPIFTGGGGIGYVLKPTFGYIIGFCVCAYIVGKMSYENGKLGSLKRLIIAITSGLLVMYFIGVSYYYVITNFVSHSYPGFSTMILYCFLITVPGDLITCILACVVSKRIHPAVSKYNEA